MNMSEAPPPWWQFMVSLTLTMPGGIIFYGVGFCPFVWRLIAQPAGTEAPARQRLPDGSIRGTRVVRQSSYYAFGPFRFSGPNAVVDASVLSTFGMNRDGRSGEISEIVGQP